MSCLLCGTQHGNEVRPRDQIEAFVAQRYVEGPFAWPAVFACVGTNVLCCVHCLNHIRKRKGLRHKQMLPLDQYLVGLVSPGLMFRMDARSRKRICKVIAEPSNPYAWPPLRPLLDSSNPIHTWWQINLRTLFFQDGGTARAVRQTVLPT